MSSHELPAESSRPWSLEEWLSDPELSLIVSEQLGLPVPATKLGYLQYYMPGVENLATKYGTDAQVTTIHDLAD